MERLVGLQGMHWRRWNGKRGATTLESGETQGGGHGGDGDELHPETGHWRLDLVPGAGRGGRRGSRCCLFGCEISLGGS